jgi:pentatricopeptide repeat protein
MVSLNAVLGGCAMHGQSNEALKTFEQKWEHVRSNDITSMSSVSLQPCKFGGCQSALLCLNEHSLHDFCNFRAVSLHDEPPWPRWVSTGGREYDLGDGL